MGERLKPNTKEGIDWKEFDPMTPLKVMVIPKRPEVETKNRNERAEANIRRRAEVALYIEEEYGIQVGEATVSSQGGAVKRKLPSRLGVMFVTLTPDQCSELEKHELVDQVIPNIDDDIEGGFSANI